MTRKELSRRGLLQLGAAAGGAVVTASQRIHPAGSDVLNIGLVGCDGQEHYALVNSIMNGNPINDGFRMANSTMLGVLGMIASFRGKREPYKELFETRFKIEPNVDNPSFDMPVASPDASGLCRIPVAGEYQVKKERQAFS